MVTRKEATKIAAKMAGISQKEIVLMTKFSPVPFAEEITKENKLIYDRHKRFWRYDSKEGVWKNDAEQFIRTHLRRDLMGEEQQKKNYVEEIISYLKDSSYNENFEPDNYPFLIPFNNKVYDLRNGTFIDFNPQYFLTNKIKIDIDEKVDSCGAIDKFFEDCVGKEHKILLYELAAYTLFRAYPFQKIFFIYGAAGTGKSIYLSLLEKLLGDGNYCSVEPHNIQRDKYSIAQMWMKLANIVSDINYDSLDNINQVKKLTGGDTVAIRQMYKDPFNAKIFAKQIFSTNKLPVVKEKTRAWYRRVFLIQFPNMVDSEKQDPFILDKLTAPKEMKGFVMKCLECLRELYHSRFRFTYDIDENDIGKIYEELSNPIQRFISENCILERDGWAYKWEFDEQLNGWLKNNHFPPWTKSQINQYMKNFYTESNRSSFNGQKTYRVWVGLRWKNSEEMGVINELNGINGMLKTAYRHKGSCKTPLNPSKLLNKDENHSKTEYK